jgi:hypothetical protein
MSNGTVLTMQSADRNCPAWCAQNPHAEATGSHVSAPVRLAAPEGMGMGVEVPVLSVEIGIGHDEMERGEPPRMWLSGSDGAAEMDSAALGSFIDELERFALSLRGLRHRYDTVIVGGAPEEINHYPDPSHPLELVAPCPPWCSYRDAGEEHTPTQLLSEHFHSTDEHEVQLALQPLGRGWNGEPERRTVDIALSQTPHARLPQIDLTVNSSRKSGYTALTFKEADELRTKLNEFLALGHEYARPHTVASFQELIDYCGVRIVESRYEAKDFLGRAVGDTKNGGPVWVTLPKNTTKEWREEWVTHLLADIHERQHELSQEEMEFRRTTHVPGAPPHPAFRRAA